MYSRRVARPSSSLLCLALTSVLVLGVPSLTRGVESEAGDDASSSESAYDTKVMDGMGATRDSDGPEASDRQMSSAAGERGWRYDTYYLFPATRHMADSGLPLYGQVMLYPLGFAIDLVQLPIGALAGLAGE